MWRNNTRGEVHDSRHFDKGFKLSGFQQDNSDGSDPEAAPFSWTVWMVWGAAVAAAAVLLLKQVLEGAL